jgi:Tfp pilus assembly PilM family ATPase
LPRFLAIDWDHSLLHVVSANVGRGGAQIQRGRVWQQEQSPGTADAETLGTILRDRLKEGSIAAAPVVMSVGRDRFILREIRYPQVPEAEEPAVVRFQAAKELTEAAEDVVIDYAPLPEPGPNGERRAQVLILRRQLLSAYEGMCRAAGLKLAAVAPRPFGIAGCAARCSHLPPAGADQGRGAVGAVAVLTVTGGWAEFCVVRDGQLLFARPLAPGGGLVGDIRRNLALYAGQPSSMAARDRVQALYVAGDGEHAVLREQLQQLLAIPVHALDPFAGIERLDVQGNRGGYTGAVGLLHAQAAQAGAINFAAPKEAKPARDPRRERVLVSALVGLLVLVGGLVVGNQVLAVRKDQVKQLTEEIGDLDGRIALFGKESEKLKELEGWTGAAVSWLDELADINQRFPDTRLMHLKEFKGTTFPGKVTGGRHTAVMTFIAEFTCDEQEVNRVVERLSANSLTSNYRLASKVITPSPDDKTPGTVVVTLEIERKAPVKGPAPRAARPAVQAVARRMP